ncbi:MAG: ferrous iron transport protein B [Defluviitaleaceae bacterium]|nr:ferrous iron transport protein B [Defluviitaleaceae bacterium]
MIKIALVGNPNSGKTTLFNALTGSNQYVGNWPGVTVEKKEGVLKADKTAAIIDLPGIYSLSPYTLEEVVSRNYLLDEPPNAILNIIDGTNLERNLFLTTQLIELGIPVVVAINMLDISDKRGDKIDLDKLAAALKCKVVAISALKQIGVEDAANLAIKAVESPKKLPSTIFSGRTEHTLAHIEEALLHDLPQEQQRFLAVKLFERDTKIIEKLQLTPEQIAHIEADIKICEAEFDDDSESIITAERYGFIETVVKSSMTIKNTGLTISDKIDRIVTHRWLALPIFVAVMFIVYATSVTGVGLLATEWMEGGVFGDGWELFGLWVPGIPVIFEDILTAVNTAEWLQSLIIDGIIAGVGAVLAFVPQLMILFIFLAFLESCGYMARIAFILDRIFRKFGLSGKSFIPILIGTGCGVPGIMASRTIESDKDRKMTVITTTFIPCSAKLPIIALISGALFGGIWWIAPSAYFLGITAIICSGVILKKTKIFAGTVTPFIMELPEYHLPTVENILRSMWERAWSFIKKAGTIILLASVIIWLASNFGWQDGIFGRVYAEYSLLSYVGRAVAWLFAPLGWGNWQAAVSTITGLIAKENLVGTFGILFGFAEVAEDGTEIWALLATHFTALSAYSFLVFNLLCAPCLAAVGAIRREMNNPRWLFFAVGYQTAFAYLVAFCVYQIGSLFGGYFNIFTVLALVFVAAFLFMLFKRQNVQVA